MRFLFASDRMHVPDDHSGSVQSTHSLVERLVERGHTCEVIASLPRRTRHFAATVLHRATRGRLVKEWEDRRAGYPVFRGSEWRMEERTERALERGAPDRLVLDSIRALRRLAAHGLTPPPGTFVFQHDASFLSESKPLPHQSRIRLIANSPFTAESLRQTFGAASDVLAPVVEFDRYRVQLYDPKYVTMISPHREKGLDLVLELARRIPEQPFLLVEGWPMNRVQWAEIARRLDRLPNVTLRRSSSDIRDTYRETLVLLNPSKIETFGRVVVEAQVSGIPVLVRDVGALGWVVGKGGVALSEGAGPDEWEAALRGLLEDPGTRDRLGAAAVENAKRSEFDPEQVVDGFLRLASQDPRAPMG